MWTMRTLHAVMQAIAMVLSNGRLAMISCLEEDDWEATVETLAAAHQPAGADIDTSVLSLGCVSLPDGIDLEGSRCARLLITLQSSDQLGRFCRAIFAIWCMC